MLIAQFKNIAKSTASISGSLIPAFSGSDYSIDYLIAMLLWQPQCAYSEVCWYNECKTAEISFCSIFYKPLFPWMVTNNYCMATGCSCILFECPIAWLDTCKIEPSIRVKLWPWRWGKWNFRLQSEMSNLLTEHRISMVWNSILGISEYVARCRDGEYV